MLAPGFACQEQRRSGGPRSCSREKQQQGADCWYPWWLSRKGSPGGGRARAHATDPGRSRGSRAPPSGGCRGGVVPPELEDVVGGRQQAPFGSGGGAAAALE